MNNDRKEQIKKLNEIYKFYNEKEKLVNLLISKFTILEIDEFIKFIKKIKRIGKNFRFIKKRKRLSR
jgi:hypothetical protein